jgi:hypothetical protein
MGQCSGMTPDGSELTAVRCRHGRAARLSTGHGDVLTPSSSRRASIRLIRRR